MVSAEDFSALATTFGNEIKASYDALLADRDTTIADLRKQISILTRPPVSIGARVTDISWDQAANEIGPLKVTRLFYHALPGKYTRGSIPAGVKLIISFKDPSTNVANYVKSIPSSEDIELVFHHEAENDYADPATFVGDFNTAQGNIKNINPAIPVAFIAGGWQYGAAARKGYSGAFIPPNADFYYMDSYQRKYLSPASIDPSVQRYMNLLADRGKEFNGFTEYGRGVVPFGGKLDPTVAAARIALFPVDAEYLQSLGTVRVWCYWYTIDGANPKNKTPDQWRMLDAPSQKAWRDMTASIKP